jgi:hypothetical protein
MTRRHRRLHVLFALGFLLGQYAALMHASQHELVVQPDKPPCQICAIAHAPSLTTTPLPLTANLSPLSETPTFPIVRAPQVQLVTVPQSRAPPASLV